MSNDVFKKNINKGIKKIKLKPAPGYETMITLQKGSHAKNPEVKFSIIKVLKTKKKQSK